MKSKVFLIRVLAFMCCANIISYASPLHTIEQSLPFKNKNDEFVKDSKSSQYIGEAIIKEEQNWPASMASGTLPIMQDRKSVV